MAKKIEVEINNAGANELRKSKEIQTFISELANNIMNRVGRDGYETDMKIMGTRAIASVYVTSDEAMHDNYKNNTLLRALK